MYSAFLYCTLLPHSEHVCKNSQPSMSPFLKREHFHQMYVDQVGLPRSVKVEKLKANCTTILRPNISFPSCKATEVDSTL